MWGQKGIPSGSVPGTAAGVLLDRVPSARGQCLGTDAAKIHITFLLGALASSSLLLHRALCLQGGRELSTAPALQRAPAQTLRLGVTLLLLHQLLHVDLYEKKPFIFANKDLMTNKASLPFF